MGGCGMEWTGSPFPKPGAAMKTFVRRFANSIHGVLSGCDRIRFRGTQRLLASVAGLSSYLAFRGVLLKEFKPFVTGVTETIRREVEAGAEVARMRGEDLHHSSVSKEERALAVAHPAGRTIAL